MIAAVAVRLLHEAGIPQPALQLLPGRGERVGEQLIKDVRVRGVIFTGSTEVVQLIHRAFALRSQKDEILFIAETGGQNAMIVDSSALPEQVVMDVVQSGFNSAGQRCSALRVLFLQEEIAPRVLELLESVRMPQPEQRMLQRSGELSGGLRQRALIASAIALSPGLLIADEPTTALDVTVQGEVLELLRDLQREHGTSLILITHDMGVVAEMADRVIILRHGRMVEEGRTADIFARPQADYTSELLAAVPRIGGGRAASDHPVAPPVLAEVVTVRDLHVRFDLHGGFFGRVDRRVHALVARVRRLHALAVARPHDGPPGPLAARPDGQTIGAPTGDDQRFRIGDERPGRDR